MDFKRLDGAPVTNQDEEKLGKVAGLFVDDTSGVPTWVSVTSGLFGAHHYLLPLAESRLDGEVLSGCHTARTTSPQRLRTIRMSR